MIPCPKGSAPGADDTDGVAGDLTETPSRAERKLQMGEAEVREAVRDLLFDHPSLCPKTLPAIRLPPMMVIPSTES